MEIGYGNGMPSRLVLPEVPVGDVPDQLPPCPGLRGEPCRDYVPFENDTSVLDGYVRPKAASPITVPLVPSFKECSESSANRVHGAPLSAPSCNPPVQSSDHLTVGAPDANGKPVTSTGSVRLKVTGESPIDFENGDQADVQLRASLTDVRNKTDLTDYTGELRAVFGIQITDRNNGPAANIPATVIESTLAFNMSCSATGGSEGGTCSATTSVDAVTGANLAREGKRAVWEVSKIRVFDGGADGDADTAGDNTLFAVQGVFVP